MPLYDSCGLSMESKLKEYDFDSVRIPCGSRSLEEFKNSCTFPLVDSTSDENFRFCRDLTDHTNKSNFNSHMFHLFGVCIQMDLDSARDSLIRYIQRQLLNLSVRDSNFCLWSLLGVGEFDLDLNDRTQDRFEEILR